MARPSPIPRAVLICQNQRAHAAHALIDRVGFEGGQLCFGLFREGNRRLRLPAAGGGDAAQDQQVSRIGQAVGHRIGQMGEGGFHLLGAAVEEQCPGMIEDELGLPALPFGRQSIDPRQQLIRLSMMQQGLAVLRHQAGGAFVVGCRQGMLDSFVGVAGLFKPTAGAVMQNAF